MITAASLMAAMFAISSAIEGNFKLACIMLAVSAILDVLDGLVARITNSMSEFGAQLDSLADMVAFGVAPATLAWLWGFPYLNDMMSLVAGLFVVMTALRLARFNTQLQDKETKSYFQGLPSPAAATLVFSAIWLAEITVTDAKLISILLAFSCVIGGLLMVSNIRYLGFKHLGFKHEGSQKTSFLGLLGWMIAALLFISQPALFMFISVWIYVAFGVAYTLYLRRQRRIHKNLKHSRTSL